MTKAPEAADVSQLADALVRLAAGWYRARGAGTERDADAPQDGSQIAHSPSRRAAVALCSEGVMPDR
jgi:hypothetical protein